MFSYVYPWSIFTYRGVWFAMHPILSFSQFSNVQPVVPKTSNKMSICPCWRAMPHLPNTILPNTLGSYFGISLVFSWSVMNQDHHFNYRSNTMCFWCFFFAFSIYIFSFFKNLKYNLQCCLSFWCTAKWFSYPYIYILFHILFRDGLSQDIEYSSLSSKTLLFIHPICNSLYLLIPYSQSILPPWKPQVCSLCLRVCFYFVNKFMCVVF